MKVTLTMSDKFLVPPKPPPELNIPSSKSTVKVSCIDRYDFDIDVAVAMTDTHQYRSLQAAEDQLHSA